MSIAKAFARKVIFPFLINSKLIKLFSAESKHNAMILMYHGVVPEANLNISPNHLSLNNFEAQIKYLSSEFNIVSLEDIFSLYRNSESKTKTTLAITFDDGYENNFKYAFPVLQKYNVPATIFTVTKQLENPGFILWYDFVDVLKNHIPLSFFQENIKKLDKQLGKFDVVINSWGELKQFLKTLNQSEKEVVLNRRMIDLQEILLKVPDEFYKLLNIEQMKIMLDSGLIKIGSHTHSHPNLDIISDEESRSELALSKRHLEKNLNIEIKSIAFPDGAYNEKVKTNALNAGYKNLLAVNYRLESDYLDKNVLPRFCISNTTTFESNIFQMFRSFKKRSFMF